MKSKLVVSYGDFINAAVQCFFITMMFLLLPILSFTTAQAACEDQIDETLRSMSEDIPYYNDFWNCPNENEIDCAQYLVEKINNLSATASCPIESGTAYGDYALRQVNNYVNAVINERLAQSPQLTVNPTTPPEITPIITLEPKPTSPQTKNNQGIIRQILSLLFGDGNVDNSSSEGETSIPATTPSGLPINQTFGSLRNLYERAGMLIGVPTCVIEAVSYIEYPSVFNYTAEQVNEYSQPGTTIPNCPWNQCSAAGHMQMTMGVDNNGSTSCPNCCWNGSCLHYCPNAWATYGNAVAKDNAFHSPDVCNLRDSTFAAAAKLKNDSGTAPGDREWTESEINSAGVRYYGNCTVPYERLNNMTYCGFMNYYCSL